MKIDVLVSKIEGIVFKAEVEDYKDYYKLLDCTTFDVVRVTWRGNDISIFIDDEGLLKPNLGRDVVYDDTTMETTPLFGHIVVTGGVDNYGRTLSVPEDITIFDLMNFISEPKYQTNG